MITVSSDITTTLGGTVATMIQQLWPVFVVAFSVIIAFFFARKLIFLFTLIKR